MQISLSSSFILFQLFYLFLFLIFQSKTPQFQTRFLFFFDWFFWGRMINYQAIIYVQIYFQQRYNKMKNYPHLYSNILNKKAQINNSRTPKKSTTFTGATFTSKASTKTLGIYNSTLNRQKKSINRTLTRSIQEHHRSFNQNQEYNYVCPSLGSEDEQLFSQSYSKIGKIKQQFPYKNIDLQLNQVLNLIKDQKLKINQKLKNLKKSNDYYKKICEGYLSKKSEIGTNTEQIISSTNEKIALDVAVGCQQVGQIKIEQQTFQNQQKQQQPSQQSFANKQAYMKLSLMLQQLNINPQDILPTEDKINDQILINDYKALTDKETIKIQKFFIKKLIEKVSK